MLQDAAAELTRSWLREAAQAGVVEAQHRLGSALLPLAESRNEAVGWLRCAAHQQHAGAQEKLLEWLDSHEQHDEYVQQLQAFAKTGDATMQYRYARLLSGSDARGMCICLKSVCLVCVFDNIDVAGQLYVCMLVRMGSRVYVYALVHQTHRCLLTRCQG